MAIPWCLLALIAACSEAAGQPSGDEDPGAEGDEGVPGATARRVEVAVVEPSGALLDLTLPGEVKGSRDATLGSALGGYVERVRVENGGEVREGQVLVQVDAQSHRARAAQARVELEAAERERDRAERLGDAIPAAQRDQAETRYAAARAAYQTASIAVRRSVIRAPFDGVVADLDLEVGEVVAPGTPVLRLVKVDPIRVEVTVSDRDVVSLSEGMTADVSLDAEAGSFQGTIARINPAANLRTRAFTVELEVPNDERRLLPGMIATVQIHQEVDGAQLLIPQDFIVTRLEGLGVYVEDGGAARWRPVQLGRVVHDQVVLEGGVEAGVRVVATGQRQLADGDPVIVVREGSCCTDGRVVY